MVPEGWTESCKGYIMIHAQQTSHKPLHRRTIDYKSKETGKTTKNQIEMRISIIITTMLLAQLRQGRGGDGITAYNCTHKDVTSEEFSLLPSTLCPDHIYNE